MEFTIDELAVLQSLNGFKYDHNCYTFDGEDGFTYSLFKTAVDYSITTFLDDDDEHFCGQSFDSAIACLKELLA